MIYQKMLSTYLFLAQLHFSAITISIFLALFIFPTSKGSEDDYYKECSSLVSCGNNHHIGYPFWGDHFRPKYCGHPAFKLQCPPSTPYTNLSVIYIDGNLNISYPVLGINNSTMTITLLSVDPMGGNQCVFPRRKLTDAIPADLIEYSSRVDNISLSCDCPPNQSQVLSSVKSFSCSHDEEGSDTTYYWKNHETEGELNRICESSIQVPVLHKANLNQGNVTLASVLELGFEVNYTNMFVKHCLPCMTSGGACGSSLGAFTCFCKGWLSYSDCRKPGKLGSPLPPKANAGNKNRVNTLYAIISGACSAGGIVLLIILALTIKKRRSVQVPIICKGRTIKNQDAVDILKICGSLAPKRYTYSSIRKITSSFKTQLGEGGFGTVYKGVLSNGRLVAVKLFKKMKGNGEDFINEVVSIGRTNHVNIVTLLGFCFEGNKRALIYEFMPNGSLEKFMLHGSRNSSLSGKILFDIAQGIAKGLDYLHRGCNQRILHFDIKPHNILLDEQLCPKISDFGLARLCPPQESSISMLDARGTIGYIAPEVFCRNFGSVSHKSDVYSYGMMLLDLVCGRKNTCTNAGQSSELYFPQWIYNCFQIGEEEFVMDDIIDDEDKCLQRKLILVSLWCIQMHPTSRPSMSRVVELLNGSLESISIPPKPCNSSYTMASFTHSLDTPTLE